MPVNSLRYRPIRPSPALCQLTLAIETRSIRILRLQIALSSTQHDIDVDCVERKDDQAGLGLLQDTSYQ